MNRRDALAATAAAVATTAHAGSQDLKDITKYTLEPFEIRVLACYASPYGPLEFGLAPGAAWNAATEFLIGGGFLNESGVTLKGWRALGGVKE